MSYSEVVEEMWKSAVGGCHTCNSFDLPVKNEHLKSFRVLFFIEFETSNNRIELSYKLLRNGTSFGVWGRSTELTVNLIDGKFPDIDQKIEALINEVESLVFDKWFGGFINMNDEFYKNKYNFRKLLLQNAKEGCVPECCVSLDACNTTTKCGHTLCMDCYFKLSTGKKCPICRERLFRKVEYKK